MPITTDGKMTAPLGVKAVANYFGVSTDVFSACTAGTINKWAKHKPIALASMGLADTPASLTADDKKAANYGLTAVSARSNSKADLPEKIQLVCGENGTWTYTKPVEGTDWARLDDFLNPDGYKTIVGYDPDAEAPCKETDLGSRYRTNEAATLDVRFTDRGKTSCPGQIHFDDLPNFGTAAQVAAHQTCLRNCYLCLAFQSGTEWYYIFSSDTLDNLVNANTGWGDEQPYAGLPVIVKDNLFTPFKNITEGSTAQFTGYFFLIDLDEAFSGSGSEYETYKGACISQTSLATHAYYVYSLPVGLAKYTNTTFSVTAPYGSKYLQYLSTVTVTATTTTVTVTVTNNTSEQQTFERLFIYLASENTFGSSDYLPILNIAKQWQDDETKVYTTGISCSGAQGYGTYAVYGSAYNGSVDIAVGETKTYTVTFNSTSDAFGYGYSADAWVMIGRKDSIQGRIMGD